MTNRHAVTIVLNLISYWHVGSGMGRGADADAVVLRDTDGLPYLPGRTLKGLLREAFTCLEESGLCEAMLTMKLFGDEGQQRNLTQGRLAVSNANLPKKDRAWLNIPDNKEYKNALYDYISFTALDGNGLAKDMTLRVIEVAVPLTLESDVSFFENPDVSELESLKKACSLIRGLGSHRNRGFGRCECFLRERSVI